jgi:TonB-linked SusC/RagA family outer membrane protein
MLFRVFFACPYVYKGHFTHLMRVMKLTVMMLIIFSLQVSALVYSQSVTLKVKNAPLERVFRDIKKQTDYLFFYNIDWLQKTEKVSIDVNNVPLETALDLIFKNQQLTYAIINNTIVLKQKNTAVNIPVVIKQESIKMIITGVVMGADNKPIAGVSVQLVGSKNGTSTDQDGRFSINIPDNGNSTLLFSFTGYESKEVKVESAADLVVNLKLQNTLLSDLVVIGYGTQKKISVTGAISSVKTNEILQSPVSSVANALAGRAPGIITVQRGGEPGRDIADIFIRGVATFAGGNSARPLVLIDGVERSLNGIDPYTIESFNILKDASATAVFGVRGANGVIIITTKTGQQGKPQFTFSNNIAWQTPIRLPKLLSAVDYAILRNEAERNDQNSPTAQKFSDYDIERYRLGDDPFFHPDINWMDYMLNKKAPQQQYNLNMSGGVADAKYFVSLGYLNQSGIYKLGNFFDDFSANPKFKRYNIRANFDFNLSKELSFFVKSSAEIQNSNYSNSATSDIFGTILSANPIMTPVVFGDKIVRNVDGLSQWNISNTPMYQMLFNGYNTNFSSRLNINIGGLYKLDRLTKGLSARTMVAYDSYYLQTVRRNKQIPLWDLRRNPNATTFQDSIVPIAVVNSFEGPTVFGSENFSKNRKFYIEAAMDYNRKFNKSNVGGLVLGTAERLYDGTNQLPFNYLGLVGRGTYNYDSRYFLDVNVGYNGSENFARGKQFGFFPSFSAGYVISNEKFFPKNFPINYLKIRGSYGLVGNDKIGGNRFLFTPSSFVNGNQYFLGLANTPVSGYREGTIGNPGVTWEKAKKLNLGVDAKLFSNLVTLTADVFKERREEILWNLNIPVTFGAPGLVSPYNIGVAENKGFELELAYRTAPKTGKLNYFASANYTFVRNKIIYFDEIPQPFPGLAQTGSRIGQPKGLLADGIYNTMEEINNPKRPISAWEGAGLKPGDIRYVDVNGDGLINDNDRVNIGNPNIPEIIYGATVGVNWKGFEITAFFQGAANVSTYLTGEAAWPFIAGTKTAFERGKESWSQERYDNGEKITLPRLTAAPDGNRHNYRISSFWLQDAAYIRFKTLEIAYSFSSKLVSKVGVKSLRVYANGQNLFTWTKMPYFDPEIASSNGSVYPMMRVVNMGLNLQF